eukprot:2782342-Rhodomonas_salina.2
MVRFRPVECSDGGRKARIPTFYVILAAAPVCEILHVAELLHTATSVRPNGLKLRCSLGSRFEKNRENLLAEPLTE